MRFSKTLKETQESPQLFIILADSLFPDFQYKAKGYYFLITALQTMGYDGVLS